MKRLKPILISAALLLCGGIGQVAAQSGSGEVVPEVARFKPVDMTDMVNLYTGEFSYTIPLLMVPSKNVSFPLNLSYASGVKVNEEASSVGLGWSLGPGAITRAVRAIPDDLDGATYTYAYDYPDDYTFGLRVGAVSLSGTYNTGTNIMSGEAGIGIAGITAGVAINSKGTVSGQVSTHLGPVELSMNSREGLQASMSLNCATATISSDGSASFGGPAAALASDPGQFIEDQGIAMACILLQEGISSRLTNGAASWHIWYSDNKGSGTYGVHGSLMQDMDQGIFVGDPEEGDANDKVGYRFSTGHRKSSGMANDIYTVFAQGLQGSLALVNEPYQPNCTFRFSGDLGAEYADRSPTGGGTAPTAYEQGTKVDCYRNQNLPASVGKIVSFVVTKPDGTRYVFGQPVYVKYAAQITGAVMDHNKVWKTGDEEAEMTNHYSASEPGRGYAIAWLLSAILFPDYVPSAAAKQRNDATPNDGIRQDLIPDMGARGNWVKFNYALQDEYYMTNLQYEHSDFTSYDSFNGIGTGADGKTKTRNRMVKEQWFLRSVETNTHVAVLEYSDSRTDGYESKIAGWQATRGVDEPASNPPRLDKVVLLNRRHVTLPTEAEMSDWSAAYQYEQKNVVGGWGFEYAETPAEQLCRGIPNSDNNSNGALDAADLQVQEKRGKLTLEGVRQYGCGMQVSLPPYSFTYYNSEQWGKHDYDRWGTFNENGGPGQHLTPTGASADRHAAQFNLKSICLPSGGSILIDYEAKKYLRVGRFDLLKSVNRSPTRHKVINDCEPWTRTLRGSFSDNSSSKQSAFKENSIYLSEYVESPLDKLQVAVWFDGGCDRHCTDECTFYMVHSFDGGPWSGLEGVTETVGERKTRSWTFPATEHSRISFAGIARTWSYNPICYTEYWNNCLWADVIVHHPTDADIQQAGISERNPKCGGGARVRRITYHPGINNECVVKNYRYEDWEDGNRCSGVASLEPPTFTKDVNDIVEPFSDYRNFHVPGPFVCYSHVVVTDGDGAVRRYKFATPYGGNDVEPEERYASELVLDEDIPEELRYWEEELAAGGEWCPIVLIDGRLAAKARVYKYVIPSVLVKQNAMWGKLLLNELVSADGKVVASTQNIYKRGLPHGAEASRADAAEYLRKVLKKGEVGPIEKRNYYVHSVGPVQAIKNGTQFASNSKINGTAELIEAMKRFGIYAKEAQISNSNQLLAANQYEMQLPGSDYGVIYLLVYDRLPVLDKIISMRDGVSTVTENVLWDSRTGAVVENVKKGNGDLEDLVTAMLPAYHVAAYAGMEELNMLEQTAQTVKYAASKAAGNAVQAQVTTWRADAPAVWHKSGEYVWKVQLNGSRPSQPLSEFPFANPANLPAGWRRATEYARYDQVSHLEERIDVIDQGVDVSTVNIYGHSGALLIGNVRNAPFKHCGVFTGDYDNANGAYFDSRNGWQKGGSQVVEVSTITGLSECFAPKCIRVVDAFGPTRNTLANGPCIMSAWVNVRRGTLKLVAEHRIVDPTERNWPIPLNSLSARQPSSPDALTIQVTNGWKYVEYAIPAPPPNGSTWCVRTWIGNPQGVEAYIQDVRIFPKDALVKSYYRDMLTSDVRAIVDENGRPRSYTYDGLRRLNAEFNARGQKIRKYEYHNMTGVCHPSCDGGGLEISYPAGGEVFIWGEEITIAWGVLRDDCGRFPMALRVDLEYSTDGGQNWTSIAENVENVPPYSYEWTIPNDISSSRCHVRVKSVTDYPVRAASNAFSIAEQAVPTRVLCVDKKLTTGADNGSSWANAFRGVGALQRALDVAEGMSPTDGNEVDIWVARAEDDDAYLPSEQQTEGQVRSKSFRLRPYVRLYGGFDGGGDELFADRRGKGWETALSGDFNGDDEVGFVNYGENAYTVVTGADNAVIDGFTIAHGCSDRYGMYSGRTDGAGMRNIGVSPRIENCTFIDNYAYFDGQHTDMGVGGAILNWNASPVINKCYFIGNMSLMGGAICNITTSDEMISTPVISNCYFFGNEAKANGGAICSKGYAKVLPRIENSIFLVNVCRYDGGAVAVWTGYSLILNCTIVNNMHGGSNSVSNVGKAVETSYSGSCEIVNSIIWDDWDGAIPIVNDGEGCTVSYSDVKGCGGIDNWDSRFGTNAGNNIDTDPLVGTYRLQETSPCIDIGNDSRAPALDRDGNGRVDVPGVGKPGTLSDIGASEYTP